MLIARKGCCSENGRLNAEKLDNAQQVTSDLALSVAELACAKSFLEYSESKGDLEHELAQTFSAEMIINIRARISRCPEDFRMRACRLERFRCRCWMGQIVRG